MHQVIAVSHSKNRTNSLHATTRAIVALKLENKRRQIDILKDWTKVEVLMKGH